MPFDNENGCDFCGKMFHNKVQLHGHHSHCVRRKAVRDARDQKSKFTA